MKPQEKATELIEKFGRKSLDILNETFRVWEIKLKYAKEDKHKRGILICENTLTYWNKVKEIIKIKL